MNILIQDAKTAVVTTDNGTEILFHHDTPVAGYIPEGSADPDIPYGYFKSATKHSVTTSGRVGKYLREKGTIPASVNLIDQDKIESFVDML